MVSFRGNYFGITDPRDVDILIDTFAVTDFFRADDAKMMLRSRGER